MMAHLESTGPTRGQVVKDAATAREPKGRAIDFSPVTDPSHRRWDPGQFLYKQVIRRFVGPWQKLLDVRCGTGIHAVRFSHLGYDVCGLDDRNDRLRLARRSARRYDLSSRCRFRSAAGALPFEADQFDVVIGIGALRTGAVFDAVSQVHRVLRPGGVAVLMQRLADESTDHDLGVAGREDDEFDGAVSGGGAALPHHAELASIREVFDQAELERFSLDDRLGRLRVRLPEQTLNRLSVLDGRLRQACPPLADLAQTVVITCVK